MLWSVRRMQHSRNRGKGEGSQPPGGHRGQWCCRGGPQGHGCWSLGACGACTVVSFQGMEYFFGPHELIFYTGAGQQAGLLHVFWCPNFQACRHGEAGGGCVLNWGGLL